jgi:hypothetical protein
LECGRHAAALGNTQRSGSWQATESGSKPHALVRPKAHLNRR